MSATCTESPILREYRQWMALQYHTTQVSSPVSRVMMTMMRCSQQQQLCLRYVATAPVKTCNKIKWIWVQRYVTLPHCQHETDDME